MVDITENAKNQLVLLMKEDDLKDKPFVRVGVESGGCSGLSYKLDFDSEQGGNDQLIEDNNIKLLVDKKSLLYLAGTVLDYSGGLNGKGFTFSNPNATRTCGCGESFSI